jgi:hypothetical protein
MRKLAIDLKKLNNVKTAIPESIERRIEALFIFDARMLDSATRQELVRLLPELFSIRQAWKAHFAMYGCISCHRKKVEYASGGLCSTCLHRTLYRMKTCFRKIDAGRNTPGEIAALTRRFDAAQRLFNGGDE